MRGRYAAGTAALLLALIAVTVLWWQTGTTQEPPIPPKPFLVEIRNDCPRSVWIFFGPEGELAPQNAANVGGHSSMTELMSAGHVLGLLDEDRRQELDRVTITDDTTSVDVLSSCDRLRLNRR